MRSICKKGSVTLVAVLALCVVASASASASQWYVGGKALSGSEKLAETTKVEEDITLSLKVINGKITCSSVNLEGTKSKWAEITAPGSMTESLVLGGCKMTGAECSVVSPIETQPLTSQLTLGTFPEDELTLTPKGKDFMVIDMEGTNCPTAGEQAMTGKFTLLVPNGQEELTEQTLVGQGSNENPAGFTWGGKEPVYLSGKLKVKLATTGNWSFH